MKLLKKKALQKHDDDRQNICSLPNTRRPLRDYGSLQSIFQSSAIIWCHPGFRNDRATGSVGGKVLIDLEVTVIGSKREKRLGRK
jgi:hypothetical protein